MVYLDVRNLSCSYDNGASRVDVLRNVSFVVERGDYVAIQGPSGSGKSTLFYVLGCMLRPTSGAVLLSGLDVAQASDDDLAYLRNRKIGFIFQQFHLMPRASVLENILLPTRYPDEIAKPKTERRRYAIDLAQRLGLGPYLDRLPNQLSGGQQQRIAIARALVQDVDLLLADEPTGNLDSHTASEILELFAELNAQGKTIIVITHDSEVAQRCRRVLQVKDGMINCGAADALAPSKASAVGDAEKTISKHQRWNSSLTRLIARSLPGAFGNIARERAKSALTVLGIVIGIAAVLAMITLGQFSKRRIMEGFEALGVNKLVIRGSSNWDRKATDEVTQQFYSFDWEKDLEPLKHLFPEVALLSPVLTNWRNSVTAGGKSVAGEVRVRGVNHEYLAISNAQIVEGRGFSPYQVASRSSVCVLGYDVAEQILPPGHRVGALLTITMDENRSFPCKVIGVLGSQKSNQEWFQPNLQVLLPYTAFQSTGNWWNSQIEEVALQVKSESNVEHVGKALKAFFERKYGKAGRFSVDAEGTLVAQTKRFLDIFAALLTSIAFLSLVVGGIGIHNMMLVSVAERIKEIGLRKALGATGRSIRVQLLVEATMLCAFGGFFGIALGFAATELMIFGAGKFMKDLPFEWIIDPWALGVSSLSIILVGILSGMVPARKAQRLQVIEALRSE